VGVVRTGVSEEHNAFVIIIKRISELRAMIETTMKQESNRALPHVAVCFSC
jgi:hypothetical protein